MVERFPDEFVTWHHRTPAGIKVDEVFGMDSKEGKVWLALARQIYCEQSDNYYRVIDHFDNGAPFLENYPGRISITHTTHFFAVAALPKTPDIDLAKFNPRTAMGIDAEPLSRSQVLNIRQKFLSEEELRMIPEDNLDGNIIAWTAKEAAYKASLFPGLNFRENIKIERLPVMDMHPEQKNGKILGEATLILPTSEGTENEKLILYSYFSYDCCVTLAYSPKIVRFGS